MEINYDINVVVRDEFCNELKEKLYDLDYDGDTIYVDLKHNGFESNDSVLWRKIEDIAREKCPEFLPHLDDLERQLSLEYLREC